MTMWTDAHTHLDSGELYAAKESVLQRAEKAGVLRMLLVNSEATRESMEQTIQAAEVDSSVRRFLSFGVHPHHANLYTDELEGMLLQFLSRPGVIAFGEFGLDYYHNYSSQEDQVRVFRRQLRLAQDRSLPLVIHCREAYGVLTEILAGESAQWRGMIHCFTGTPKEAEDLLSLGFTISFSGIVTFRTAEILRQAALAVPPDKILVETDAPYLAPVPMRGKMNEPSYVIHTAQFLASLRNVALDEFASQTNANFDRLFGIS